MRKKHLNYFKKLGQSFLEKQEQGNRQRYKKMKRKK